MRCKFRLDRIERSLTTTFDPATRESGTREVQTIVMSPVYGNGDPEHENTRFFAATPFGEFKVGTVNAEAVKGLVLGAEYYLDITPAPKPGA